MLKSLELRLGGSQQRLHIALGIVEISRCVFGAPLALHRSAPSQTRHAHRLGNALHLLAAFFNRRLHAGIARKHAPQLKDAHPAGLAILIVFEHSQQAANERGAHHGKLAGNRVEQPNRISMTGQLTLPALFHKAEIDGFRIAQSGQGTAHGKAAFAALGARFWLYGGQRRGFWQLRKANDPHHLLNQVFFQSDVKAVHRRFDGDHIAFASSRQTELGKDIQAFLRRDGHTNHLAGAAHAQLHFSLSGHVRLLIIDDRRLPAANLLHQARDALHMRHREHRIHTALKAMPGVGGKIEAPRTARHSLWPPESGFDVDVLCLVAHGGRVAAHDASQRFNRLVIGNDANFFV